MKKQVFNPFLPLDEYIPDGEPHVFGDRVYLYGSHDKEAGEEFCMLPYRIWSAPVDDLSDWSNKGFNYELKQDPVLTAAGKKYMYAPDCVMGNDGRFYLYYCSNSYAGPIGVAVCDTPDGKFEFYGHVKNPDGTYLNRFIPGDPALINDGGTIRLYYGTYYPFDETDLMSREQSLQLQTQMFNKTKEEIEAHEGGIFGPATCELEDDMLTVKTPPVRIMPAKLKGTPYEVSARRDDDNGGHFSGHGFYEGASIRKIGDVYYFVYSSANNHELCYSTSKYPDRDFEYGGTIVSNGDIGYKGRSAKNRLNHTGTNHGSIENINGQWYVFYHRQTHGTDYSRQACAEPIEIRFDGRIEQVEITTSGLYVKSLPGAGKYPAAICCNLSNGNMPHTSNKKAEGFPMVTSRDNERFITAMTQGVLANYKYFDLSDTFSIKLTARGEGRLLVKVDGKSVSEINVSSGTWKEYATNIFNGNGKSVLSFEVKSGNLDLLSFELN